MGFNELTLLAANKVAGQLPFKIRQGQYSTFTFDLVTGTRLSNAPMRIEEVSRSINEAATGALELPVVELTDDWPDWITPRRTGVCVVRDRAAIWSGIIWAHTPTADHQSAQIHAETFESYLAARWLEDGYIFGQDDQADILKTLLDDVFAVLGGNVRITVPTFPATGRLRDRNYEYTEFKILLETVQQLAGVEDGFDFTIETALDVNDQTLHTVRMGYPRLGVGGPGDVGSLVWQYPGSVVEPPSWPFDGRNSSNEVAVIGAGESLAMLYAISTDSVAIEGGYPLMQRKVEQKDVTILSTLLEHSVQELDSTSKEITVPEFTALAGVDPVIGSFGMGDWARVIINTPYLRGMYGGVGADHFGRLTGWTLRPGLAGGTSGVETVTPRLHEIVEA